MGTIGIGALIARWGFWVLMVYGWRWGELSRTSLAVFGALWLMGFLARSASPLMGNSLFTAFVAMLDVALVLKIFKGDVRI